MLRALRAAALLVVAGYAAIVGYMSWSETDLVFHPTRDRRLVAPAESLALRVERVSFAAADSVPLVAWVIPAAGADPAAPWMIICHGNYGSIAYGRRPLFYARMRDLGVNLLAFDYRGFGESGGAPSERGVYEDALAAYRYLRRERGVPPERIVIFGHSLGSGVATELATRVRAAGLVVEGAFTSVADRGQELYPWLPVRLIARNRFESIAKIDRVAMPKLFLHSPADSVIPFAHARALVSRASAPKRLVEVRGGHEEAFLVDRATYYGAIARFLREAIPGSSASLAAH